MFEWIIKIYRPGLSPTLKVWSDHSLQRSYSYLGLGDFENDQGQRVGHLHTTQWLHSEGYTDRHTPALLILLVLLQKKNIV